ncbi:alkane 1-monooxygenase [Aquimarina sp. EL_43]|uniref:alkane 1-monooxygenase n=1 Tax=unclassified Aquimarina TaxID=2627091 RepID=UPI0018C97C81|nr:MULTISPECIES: alkane 1-monooxygenase [unclassified Aquimarina]MBG6133065.1 alkane 1-monooxygenase [Aquimarina sp. EL_35]MBG6153223.1 alkane 1-monooxygenase [Aquimarina sp. EL_32]MBG6171508.1 alkane 1-monooxygenase [Aquimarina sp. EL_43]
MKDLKYICAYTIPFMAIIGIWLQGIYTYLTPIYAFGLIPILELFTNSSTKNLDDKHKILQSKKKIFDWMLYINLPIVYGILLLGVFTSTTSNLDTYEIIGIIISLGIVLGSNGINVGHELGHRYTKERYIGKALLLPSLYMHFYIEHNFGHHLNVATKEDPATARYNQPVYFFWITSTIRQYINAWKIQFKLLKQNNQAFLSVKNDMLCYFVITLLYLTILTYFFGFLGLLVAFLSGVTGFLLPETINYIEHYGLVRRKTSSGRYERVREIHSWNSNHTLGRIMLYELTRHSDHHHRASKKYQILDHHDKSPQLPFGYPTSMVLSLLPPLWFLIMNKRVPREMKSI